MKYWEIIADQLSQAGWTWGYVSAVDAGRNIYVADAHRGDGNRYIVRSDELLTAFHELLAITSLVTREGTDESRFGDF